MGHTILIKKKVFKLVMTKQYDSLKKGSISQAKSAQQGELHTFIQLSELQTVNIYTNSWYAFGFIHDFGMSWGKEIFLYSLRPQ